jgi:hypothetical protein
MPLKSLIKFYGNRYEHTRSVCQLYSCCHQHIPSANIQHYMLWKVLDKVTAYIS